MKNFYKITKTKYVFCREPAEEYQDEQAWMDEFEEDEEENYYINIDNIKDFLTDLKRYNERDSWIKHNGKYYTRAQYYYYNIININTNIEINESELTNTEKLNIIEELNEII